MTTLTHQKRIDEAWVKLSAQGRQVVRAESIFGKNSSQYRREVKRWEQLAQEYQDVTA